MYGTILQFDFKFHKQQKQKRGRGNLSCRKCLRYEWLLDYRRVMISTICEPSFVYLKIHTKIWFKNFVTKTWNIWRAAIFKAETIRKLGRDNFGKIFTNGKSNFDRIRRGCYWSYRSTKNIRVKGTRSINITYPETHNPTSIAIISPLWSPCRSLYQYFDPISPARNISLFIF